MDINVLCLHGCNQTEEMFKRLLKTYIQLGEKQYNLKFHFTEAKYDHPDGGKTWYNKSLNVEDIGTIEYDKDLVEDCMENISELIKSLNIHVLLGFSQGGNVVDTFLSHHINENIICAVIMSGYSLVDSNRLNKIDVPVLTVISESDNIVPIKWNPNDYIENYVLNHDKGHKLPTKKLDIRKICIFIQSQKY